MARGWITGKEIMEEYGKAATEIGQACYDGLLHAFTADVLLPVLEQSKLPHIPKYPPVGVDPRDHVQYTATPRWNWNDHIKTDLHEEEWRELLAYETSPTRALREQGLIPFDMDLAKLNADAVDSVHTQKYVGGVDEDIIVPNLALSLMENCFDFDCITDHHEAKFFCFLFSTFHKWYCFRPSYRLNPVPEQEIIAEYKKTLEKLWFKRDEVSAWTGQKIDQTHEELPEEQPMDSSSKSESVISSDVEENQKDVQIKKWRGVQRHLKDPKLIAAKLAVQKWHGKSHEEAYSKVFPRAEHARPIEFVSKKKILAEKIVQENSELAMPPWSNKK